MLRHQPIYVIEGLLQARWSSVCIFSFNLHDCSGLRDRNPRLQEAKSLAKSLAKLTAPPRLSALCYAASEERKGDLVWTGQLASGRLRETGIPLAGYYCQVKYRTPS